MPRNAALRHHRLNDNAAGSDDSSVGSALLPVPRSDHYTPGTYRRATDPVLGAISHFVDRHPEYGRLSHDAIEQAMDTYRTEEEHDMAAKLREAGVPAGRRGEWSDDA